MKKTLKINAIAFDMDGVIIDSNTAIETFWKEWIIRERLIFTDQIAIQYIHGRTTIETINELFKNSANKVKEEILKSAIDFDMNMRPGLIKGADQFLKNLVLYSDKIALVTSAPEERAKKMLELNNIDKYFTYSVTGDEVKNGKPDPEPYLKAADKMNIDPGECLVFEDSNNGIISAAAAGMNVIAVNNFEMKNEKIITIIKDYCTLQVEGNVILIDGKPINIELSWQ